MANTWDEFEAEIDAAKQGQGEESEEEPSSPIGFTNRVITWGGKGPISVVHSQSPEEVDHCIVEFQKSRRKSENDMIAKKLLSAGSALMMVEDSLRSDRCRQHADPGKAPHGAEVVAIKTIGEVFDVAFGPPILNSRGEKHCQWLITAEGSPNALYLWTWSFLNDLKCGKCRSEIFPNAEKCRRCGAVATTHAVMESTRLRREYIGHSLRVTCCAVSPNGNYFMSGSDDKEIRIWRVGRFTSAKSSQQPTKQPGERPSSQRRSRGKCIRVIHGHTAPITSLRISQDGAMLISSARDGTARLWDVSPTLNRKSSNEARGAYVTPDHIQPYQQLYILTGFVADVTAADFAHDSTFIVVGGFDPYLRLYPMFNDNRINARAYKCQSQVPAHIDWVLTCGFWRPAEARMVLPDTALAGRDARYGAVDENGHVQKFIYWEEKEEDIFRSAADYVSSSDEDSLSIHTDDDEDATAEEEDEINVGDRDRGSSVRMIQLGGGRQRPETKREQRLRLKKLKKLLDLKKAEAAKRKAALRIKPVKQWPFMCASAGADYSIKIWNVFTQKLVRQMKSGLHSSYVDADSTLQDDTTQQVKKIENTPGNSKMNSTKNANHVIAVSKETALVVHGDEDAKLKDNPQKRNELVNNSMQLSASEGNLQRSYFKQGHVDQITCVDFSPDGSMLASSGGDGRVLLWNVDTGDIIEKLTAVEGKNCINVVQFSPDGVFICGGEYGKFRLWRSKGLAKHWEAAKKDRDVNRVAK